MHRFPMVRIAALALAFAGVVGPDVARAEGEEATAPTLAKAEDFTLKGTDGKEYKLSDQKGKWVVLEWTNLGCPFVKKHYVKETKPMQGLQKKYAEKGVVWFSICSSAPGKQGHMTPDGWKAAMADNGMAPKAVLLDEDGKVGKAYGARTTPEIWVINPKGEIEYHGAADDTSDAKADVTKAKSYISQTLDAVLEGKAPPVRETKPYGCSVKYAD
jgi:peroxiredoxin